MIMSARWPVCGSARVLAGMPLALTLGLGLLIVPTVQRFLQLEELVLRRSALMKTVGVELWGTPLGGEVLRFAAHQILLHLGFGVSVWLLALMTEAATPSVRGRRNLLTVAWFGIGVLWVLLANATLYPWSQSGLHAEWLVEPLLAGLRLFDIFTVLVVALIAVIGMRAALTFPRVRVHLPRVFAYGAVLLMFFLTAGILRASDSAAPAPAQRQPNIIIIGIDSLRRDTIGEHRGLGVTPNVDHFLRGAHLFADAVTPLARTYPSWISILTGKYPRSTGARENLLPRPTLREFRTLPEMLRSQGYYTIYATDETRFSNIDETYGFDAVITPTIGAADFLLGKAGDLPLSNLVVNTRLGRLLFPPLHANRAAFQTYRPSTFIDWLEDEIEPAGPTMLAVHLTLPHWPYRWAEPDDRVFSRSADRQYLYLNAVIAADRQFGELMDVLERKGFLGNAIVVLLSDHGEALGVPATDTLLRGQAMREVLGSVQVSLWGHGSSVLSPPQYSPVLAIRGYGPQELSRAGAVHTVPVSFVDIAPTLLDLAGLPVGEDVEGLSLRPILHGDPNAAELFGERPRFTETGFRTPLVDVEDIDELKVFDEAAAFFRMNPQNGRIEIRPELMPRLLADKERAVITGRWLLAAIPATPEAQRHDFLLVDRRAGLARRLVAPPDPQAEPEIARLWDALHAHYAGELAPPAP